MLTGFISSFVSVVLLIALLEAAVFPIGMWSVLVVPAALVPVLLLMSRRVCRAAVEPPRGMHAMEILDKQVRADGLTSKRERGGGKA